MFAGQSVFQYIFCVLNCDVFGAEDYRTCTKVCIIRSAYKIKPETVIINKLSKCYNFCCIKAMHKIFSVKFLGTTSLVIFFTHFQQVKILV